MIPSDLDLVNLCAEIYQDGGYWDHLDTGTDDEIYWGLKKLNGRDVIVFRGSITAHDWIEDLRYFPAKTRIGTVHEGFYTGLEKMWGECAPLLNQPTMVTGHSLGAARADILCALMVADERPPVRRAVFGEPRPGMPDFARFLKDVAGNGYRNGDARGHDLVTDVPLPVHMQPPFLDLDFSHPKPLVDISASPTGDLIQRREPFAYHHVQLYQAAMAAYLEETAA